MNGLSTVQEEGAMVATRRGSQGNLTCAGTPAMWWARNVVHPQCGPSAMWSIRNVVRFGFGTPLEFRRSSWSWKECRALKP